MINHEDKDKEVDYTQIYHWNKKPQKKPWLLYTLIAVVSFALAWVMS